MKKNSSLITFIMVISLGMIFFTTGCGKNTSQKGVNTARSINKALQDAKNAGDPAERAQALASVAIQQKEKMKDLSGAKNTIELAYKACGEIEDPTGKVQAYSKLAEALGTLGDRSKARQAISDAEVAMEQIKELAPETAAGMYVGLAGARAAASDAAGGAKVLEKALKQVEKVELLISKVDLLRSIANGYLVLGDNSGLEKTLTTMEKLGENADARTKSDIYSKIAAIQFQMKNPAANDTFQKAVDTVKEIEESGRRSLAYCELAMMIRNRDKDQAKKLVKLAMKASEEELDTGLRNSAEEKIGEVKGKLGM